jgi:leucyl-tRNA synthetase
MEKNEKKQKQEKGGNRLAHLREIEKSCQELWEKNKIFESKPEENWIEKEDFNTKNSKKFFCTFPYPYMNGRLHLGHAFSLSKCEFQSRYQRLLGKNVLFPFGFHCTGMPMAAAAKKVQKELEEKNNKDNGNKKNYKNNPSQIDILKQLGIPEEEIPKFADPLYWLEYFPPIGKQDLMDFGLNIDFSRSFITTEKQQFYDKFIQWQMIKLKKQNRIRFGKRHAIFSISDDQPCADHDRSEGEGLGPQEYTLIKMKLLFNEKLPEKLKELINNNKNIFLVAATLRPETMYGQTNCYILPNGEYGLYEMNNSDYFITSQHSILNMAYQEMTKEPKKVENLLKIKGKELIACKILAPLSIYKEVYLFPMETILMDKGTGIVTSVPSDSPDDYINLLQFKNNEKLRKKWGITLEMIYEPVHILNLEGYGPLPAKDAVERLDIKSPKDKEKLKKAKEEVYTNGFYKGILDIGNYKGEPIKIAKDKVKNDLVKSEEALLYFEPEGVVKNRQNEECVVALVDQWYITYGEDDWKQFLLKYIHSGKFKTYSQSTLKALEQVIDWLSFWGLSRTFGLGTHIPWDKQYLIESLSDSTIYMAYYTIANYLHEDLFGLKNKNDITPEMLTEEVFDYIFLGKELDFSKCQIKENILKEMRNSFTYWYPVDLRCSGKDLIGNHLTMSLYNHAAIWNLNEDYMTRAYFCNGYILVKNRKMAKSQANFLTIKDLIDKFGVDASRIALADCGDTLDDANFVPDLCDLSINKLYSFENFVKILIYENWDKNNDFKINDPDKEVKLINDFDKMFDNNINYLIEQTKNSYDEMKYKNVLKYAFYMMINSKDEYILFNNDDYNKLNPSLMVRFFKVFFIMMNPIIPHWTEYMYKTYLNPLFDKNNLKNLKIEFLYKEKFPIISNPIDKKLFDYNQYIHKVIQNIREIALKSKTLKGGKKEENTEEKKEEKFIHAKIIFAKEFSDNQKLVLQVLKEQTYDENGKISSLDEKGNPGYKNLLIEKFKDNQKEKTMMLEFASYKAKEVENYGKEILEEKLQFNEEEVLKNNIDLFKKLTKVGDIEIIEQKSNEELKLKNSNMKDKAMPGKPIFQIKN